MYTRALKHFGVDISQFPLQEILNKKMKQKKNEKKQNNTAERHEHAAGFSFYEKNSLKKML